MAMKWYIETWSVVDGIAFATRRHPTDSEPSLTLALQPPYWDPIAVSNPATALRALAHGYQHRLYDDQDEVPFDTLDEVREVVRRGYNGGGIGFGPAPGPGPAPSPNEGSPRIPSPKVNRERGDARGWPEVRNALASIHTNREEAHEHLRMYVSAHTQQIHQYHQDVTMDYIPLLWSNVQHDRTGSSWQDAAIWCSAVWDRYRWPRLDDELRRRMHSADADAYYWFRDFVYDGPRWKMPGDLTAGAILGGSLFRIPVQTALPRITTMGDLLAAACSSRRFVRNLEAGDFYLLLMIALMVIRGTHRGPWLRDWPADLDAASHWLVDSLPGVLPPMHRAEALLDRFVESQT